MRRDRWEFAVELEQLVARGATVSDLRFLASNGYVEHGREITRPGDPARRYEAARNLAFSGETCFVATEAGLAILGASTARAGTLAVVSPPDVCSTSKSAEAVAGDGRTLGGFAPRWDAISRSLTLGGRIVKRYRVPSPNQQAILAAFEEEGWPRAIDDPLPYAAGHRPKERLHATIRCLNANQAEQLLRFRGDGTGERVLWEPMVASIPSCPAAEPRLRRAA
jgi:hypothetical protein